MVNFLTVPGVFGAVAVAVYVALLAAMLAYGANCAWLVLVHRRLCPRAPVRPAPPAGPLPAVTVQLPVYNELNVVGRLLEAVAELDWPRGRLQVQVLDDSSDATTEVIAEAVARLRADGLDIVHLHRHRRVGFKAGALAEGLRRATGELIAIFDADFVPPPDFLRDAVSWFADARVAAVQGRWTHLNRDHSGLTRIQALAIDGHFAVEQAARCWAGWLLNFNGTAGVWRREAIEAAGGWTADTLTEDLDLSYRAQLAGWRIVYDPELRCPAELPATLGAFKAQQRRWATGSMQCARKLLPRLLRADLAPAAKLQAVLHLTHYAVHALIAATALLSVPCVLIPGMVAEPSGLWAVLLPFALAMAGPTLLYVYAQRALGHPGAARLGDLLRLTVIGVGLAASNARAVWAGLRGRGGSFVRTPKLGAVGRRVEPRHRYRVGRDRLAAVELWLALYCLLAAVALVWTGVWVIAPFMLLDAVGLSWVGAATLREDS